MKIYKIVISVIIAVSLSSCSTSSKLTNKAWAYFSKEDYQNATKYFLKATKRKGSHEEAYQGLSSAYLNRGDYIRAEYYIEKAYRIKQSSINTYNYAAYANLNGKSEKAMNLLFELPSKGDFDYYRKKIANSGEFKSLQGSIVFNRYLSGYRRIKIQPYYGFSSVSDGPFNKNDLFVLVENNKRIILVTDIFMESNTANWTNNYVIFDYPLNSEIRIVLMDQDIVKHDIFVDVSGLLARTGDFAYGNNSSIVKARISDAEATPFTTGTKLPKEVSLSELALGIGGLYLVSSSLDLDNSFMTSLIDCSTKAGIQYFIENPLYSATVEEAYNSIRKRRGYSFNSVSNSVKKNLLIQEIRNMGHPDIASTIEAADYLFCVFGND